MSISASTHAQICPLAVLSNATVFFPHVPAESNSTHWPLRSPNPAGHVFRHVTFGTMTEPAQFLQYYTVTSLIVAVKSVFGAAHASTHLKSVLFSSG